MNPMNINTMLTELSAARAGTSPEGNWQNLVWNDLVKVALLLTHWRLAEDEQTLWSLLRAFCRFQQQPYFQIDDQLMAQLLQQWPVQDTAPRIWACYHCGPYGLVTRALLQQGCGVAVLLRDDVYEEQREIYAAHFRWHFGRDPKANELRFVRSGGVNCLIQLKRAINEGMHVLCYIDGIEGAVSDKGRLTVQLHGVPIDVRYGIAVLSHWTGTSIRPLLLSMDDDRLCLHSQEDQLPRGKDDYIPLMQCLYSMLENIPPSELMQWECIPNLCMRVAKSTSLVHGKPAYWMPVDRADQKEFLLMDMVSMRTVAVSEQVYQQTCTYVFDRLLAQGQGERILTVFQ
jgi:hypothetical protein